LFAGSKHKQKALKKGALTNAAQKPAQTSTTTSNNTTITTTTTATTTGTNTISSKGTDATNYECMTPHGVPQL
jgi:hypothetical protein